MKKLIVTLLLAVFLGVMCAPALAQDPAPSLTTLWQEKTQRQIIFDVRAALEETTNNLQEGIYRVQELAKNTNFDTIPDAEKVIFVKWLNAFKALRTTLLGDAEIKARYDWRP